MEKEIWNESGKPGLVSSTKLFFKDLFVGAKRISRADFWWGYLGTTIFFAVLIALFVWTVTLMPISDYYWSAILGVAAAISFGYYLIAIYNAGIRRLHDVNLSAWWMLLLLLPGVGYLVLLVLCSLEQRVEGNRHDMVLNEA
ncbi:DUF805 domain-containing protein [Companilactobacillus ginsenosidimutans]|uniref:DUF805 domain-containing protein n=1 Tax=Companilactobacillus ginsenosidimutans TaxID=1007676 RepID=A0A0H4QMV2_9LACO|nr:DUF805 domain-containing protein [Companilactobacillus ginsenosidimutans]AKP68043.1 hypothetical protein ABM34_11195 [Companilactobacillus ginsenosidimutans]